MQPTPARRLYISTRFAHSREIAEAVGANYLILSAEHGLLLPGQVVAPYETDLRSLDTDARATWAEAILEGLRQRSDGKRFVVLGTATYAEALMQANERAATPIALHFPLAGLSQQGEREWLARGRSLAVRIRDLKQLYMCIDQYRDTGSTFLLKDLGANKIPEMGVYIFLDHKERNFLGNFPRIVRVGTHGVSAGSRSTLRIRLRTHLGSGDGSGSHRASVFRLHVGRAMLNAAAATDRLPSWGQGQDAPRDVRASETAHEKLVTAYLAELEVFLLDINDVSGTSSMRAFAETQLIALLTEGYIHIDSASEHWLGSRSPSDVIRKSGLWNIRDVAKPYRAEGKGNVSDLTNRDCLGQPNG